MTVAGANGSLTFSPSKPRAGAGCIRVTLQIEGPHTLQFTSGAAATVFPLLDHNQPSWAGVPPARKYPFRCTTPTDAASGMLGTLVVT